MKYCFNLLLLGYGFSIFWTLILLDLIFTNAAILCKNPNNDTDLPHFYKISLDETHVKLNGSIWRLWRRKLFILTFDIFLYLYECYLIIRIIIIWNKDIIILFIVYMSKPTYFACLHHTQIFPLKNWKWNGYFSFLCCCWVSGSIGFSSSICGFPHISALMKMNWGQKNTLRLLF